MTADEKLAGIAATLRFASSLEEKGTLVKRGGILELVLMVGADVDGEELYGTVRSVIPEGDCCGTAYFCELYCKYFEKDSPPFMGDTFTAELPSTVTVPEIQRITTALSQLSIPETELLWEYGESFSACAADVESGRCRYVLLPMTSPEEGRLYSFDHLRRRYGLSVHGVLNINVPGDGVYGYQLCAVGYPCDTSLRSRLSFTADLKGDGVDFLSATKVFGAAVLSCDVAAGRENTVLSCVLDVGALSYKDTAALYMYLTMCADVMIDGYYNEY